MSATGPDHPDPPRAEVFVFTVARIYQAVVEHFPEVDGKPDNGIGQDLAEILDDFARTLHGLGECVPDRGPQ